MANRITVADYNADWAFIEHFQHLRSHKGYLTREDVISFYGTLGVDGLEYTHSYWYDCPASYARRVAENAGLPVICYIFGVDLAQAPSARQPAMDEAKRLLDRTAELGARLAMITPAIVKPEVPLEEQRKWLIDGLRACAEYGQSAGVTVCIENLDDPEGRPLMGAGYQCRDLCAAVDSPGLRLIYDCGAPLFVDADSLQTLRDMLPYVAHVHIKNSRLVDPQEKIKRYLDSVGGRRYTGTVLDGGAVDVAAVIMELQRVGYGGYMLIEYQGMDDPRQAVAYNVNYLRGLMGKEAAPAGG